MSSPTTKKVKPEDFKNLSFEITVDVELPAECIYGNVDCPICPRYTSPLISK